MSRKRAQFETALNRGHSHSWDQNWTDAIAAFQEAVAFASHEPAPYAGLGMAYFELQELEQALDNYKKAARYSKGDIIYLRQIASVQERLEQDREAGQTYMAIGETLLRRRHLDEAVESWHRAVRLDPNLLGGHQRLALVYKKQGLNQSAIREYLAMARILQARGDREKAEIACQTALQLDPRNPEVLTAIELVQQNEALPSDEFEQVSLTNDLSLTDELPELADVFDGDGAGDWGNGSGVRLETSNPVQEARRMALEQLAAEIFDEGSEEELDLGLSKLQRDALISQALDYQTRGLANEAISCYEQAVAMGVNSTAVHFNLGLMYQDRLRFEDAIREFEIAINDSEFRLGAHFALGESYRARGRIEDAVEHFITVLKIVDLQTVRHNQADRLIRLYENLADSLVKKGEPEKATAFANTLVEFLSHKGWEDKVKEARTRLDSLSAEGTMILGDILTSGSELVLESLYLSQEYAKRGMYNAAIEEAYRVIQLSPEYLPAHLQLGTLLAKQKRLALATQKFVSVGDAFQARGDVNNAMMAYEQVVYHSPLDIPTRSRLIEMTKRHGQIDRALEHYEALGDAYYQLAQLDRTRETYQQALKLTPRGSAELGWRVKFLRHVADIDMQRLDWPRALVSYRELNKEQPGNEKITLALIDLYYKVGQAPNARRTLDQHLVQLIKSGQGSKVTSMLESLQVQHPEDDGLVERLARLYAQQNRREKAVELLDRLGEEQLNSGRTEKAIATIEMILSLSPPNADSYKQLVSELRRGFQSS